MKIGPALRRESERQETDSPPPELDFITAYKIIDGKDSVGTIGLRQAQKYLERAEETYNAPATLYGIWRSREAFAEKHSMKDLPLLLSILARGRTSKLSIEPLLHLYAELQSKIEAVMIAETGERPEQ